MKLKVNQRDLWKHISIAQKGISSRTTLQILDGILLDASENRLNLIGTDLEISIDTFVECEVERSGSIVVDSKIFGDIVRKLPDAPIYINVVENNINLKCEESEFNLIGNSSEEYPYLPVILEKSSFEFPKDLLKTAIRQTIIATSQDESRPSLTGVLLEVLEDKISFVALDGYRLALKRLPAKVDLDFKVIIPGRTLNELNKIIEENEEKIIISSAPSYVVFEIGNTTIYSRVLEGQFFNYKEIIRQDHKTKAIVNKRSFQDGLERASLLAREEKANLVKLTIKDGIILIRSNSEIGDVNENIAADISGEEMNIAFNSKYILEGVKVIDADEIQLNFMGSLNPCIINPVEDENYTYLVLPVRLAQDDF
ncbi:MAG: DNA polymerase III subunit beta [Tissierellaceae bacterium]|nr:DNA polymerase III subunit beta [Tissierellaceae bacterium]